MGLGLGLGLGLGFGCGAATMAQTRLEKTQKAAEGKRPVSYSVVIT